ncbi:hypothetical protein D1872_245070 [compost metagenome]
MVDIRHAVNLYLRLDLQVRLHFRNFVHVQLAGQYGAGSAFAPPVVRGRIVRRGHFGVPVQCDLRGKLTYRLKHCGIAELNGVHAGLAKRLDIIAQFLQLVVMQQFVDADVNLGTVLMAKLDRLSDLISPDIPGQAHAVSGLAD